MTGLKSFVCEAICSLTLHLYLTFSSLLRGTDAVLQWLRIEYMLYTLL
jgi:hypothetical protein